MVTKPRHHEPFTLAEFDRRIQEASRYLGATTCSDLQHDAICDLEELSTRVAERKEEAIAERNEDFANLLLGCECLTEALVSELRMWILLKKEEPSKAWDKLVDAQVALDAAPRAHRAFNQKPIEAHYERLEDLERVVFPAQMFMSVGMLVNRYECSVCGGDYEDCPHTVGKPYMGRFCVMVINDIAKLDHVALVGAPRDKRCRVTAFQDGRLLRDTLTMRVLEDVGDNDDGTLLRTTLMKFDSDDASADD